MKLSLIEVSIWFGNDRRSNDEEKIHIRQAELQDLDAIERIELENFSEEEAIAREILKDHIERFKRHFL